MRKYLSLFLIILSVLMSVSMSAAGSPVSARTPVVKGHVPVATGVTITGPAAPVEGDTLRLDAGFSDPDMDAESDSLMQWYHDDGTAITGATGQEYVLQTTDAGKRIQGGYTPKTDPLITDPDTGVEVKSALTVLIMGKPDGAKSTFTQDRGVIAATGADKAILTLTLKDSAGNPVSGIAARLSLAHTATDGLDAASLTTDDRGNGVYEFSVTGTQPGTVVFTPQMDGVVLATLPATRTLVLTGDSATAQITASGLTVTRNDAVADDSATNQVQAVVTDAAGRPVSGVAVSFTTVAPAHITVSTGVTDIHGVATASLASPQSGPVAVTAKINSTGSEQTVDVNFMAGAPSASNSTLTAGASVITANGGGGNGTSLLTLTLKDAKGNLVTGLTDVVFTVAGVADTTLTAVTESPAGSGVYTATLSGTTAGTATVTASAGGAVLGGLQAQVSLAADITTAAVRTVTETTGGAKADNVSTNTLTATVEDANGNRVPNVTVDWSVTTGIATLNSATSTTDSNGQAVITVKDMTAETATITAKAGSNAADGGQTADTVFSLYPVVSGITQGVNNSPADNATQNTLTVQIADLAGNALKNQNVTLSLAGTDLKTGPATLKNGANALTAASTSYAVTTDANGQVMLTATDVTAETISVSVKTSTSTQAAVTKTSTFALYPVLNAADISVPLDGAPSDAASLNTLKVIVRDLKGNPVGGQTVNWSMNSPSGKALFSPSAGITAVSTSNSSGEAVINLTDRRMENVTVTAKVAGGLPEQTQSKDTRFMQYVALTITGLTNNNCAVTCAITVNVNAKDIDGNPLVNLKVGSHSAAYGGGSSGFTLSSTDASGNVAVLRPMTVAAVDTGVYAFADSFSNPGVISATRSGNVSEYRSASTTVVTTSPALYTGNLAANITAHCSGPVVDIYITTTGGVFPAGGVTVTYSSASGDSGIVQLDGAGTANKKSIRLDSMSGTPSGNKTTLELRSPYSPDRTLTITNNYSGGAC